MKCSFNKIKRQAFKSTFLAGLILSVFILPSQNEHLKSLLEKVSALKKNQNYDSAMFYTDKLLEVAQTTGVKKYIISGSYNKASIFSKLNQPKESVEWYYKALKLCTDTSDNKQKAYIYNNLGVINYEQKNVNLAKYYFKEEIAVKKQIGNLTQVANSLVNLSAVHRILKEYDSSAIVLNDLKNIVNKLNDEKLSGFYYHANGVHYQSTYSTDSAAYKLDSAANNYNKALSIWIKMNDEAEAFRPLFNLGYVYHLKKEFGKALVNYLEAKKIAENLGLFGEKVKIFGNLAEIYYDTHDYKNAADYFRQYIELKDSVNKSEIADYTLKLDKQFQTEKNRELIQKQKLEIAEQELQLNKQSKRIYLALFIIVLVMAIAVFIFIYFNFQKRVKQNTEDAKKKFFSNVVHEIRTPLSMIQAPLKVLKSRHHSEDDQYNIDIAERNIKRLNELVNQMLDISKIESTRYVLNETFGDLEIFFTQLIGNYNKMAAEKGILLLHQFNLQSKLAFFDKDALEKMTGNLLSNAIKYTASNHQIGMDVYGYDAEDGLKLTINVWDTGVGISENEQDKIFTRFYRSSATATTTKGVGIGLSLVKDLADLLKGTIEVKSKEGKGSTFTINLILKMQNEKVTDTALESIDENAQVILLVEDDIEILNFNANYLTKNSLAVLKAFNGKEALELVEKTLPDLIITDLMMPELDGLSLLKTLRKNEVTSHIPIIILSAKASSESRMEALKLGAQAYIAKPFLPDELFTLVINQLEILSKRKTEFKEQITQTEKTVEEKYVGQEPYTKKLFALIFQQLDNPELSVEGLADLMATNRSHFQRKIKAITGLSPSELVRTIRLEKAKEFLLERRGNITEVAYQTGFSSQSYFTKCFVQHFGTSPSQMLQDSK